MKDTYLDSLLGENEQVLFVTRRHWLVLAGEILSESVLTLALIVLVTIIWLVVPASAPWIALGYLLLVLPLVSLSHDVLVWTNRKFIITNRRVIHVEGVLSKDVTDSSLEKVNDVKMEQSFWGRLLGYGNIEILTASELGVNKFAHIADPIRFKTAMLNAKNRLDRDDDQPAALKHAPARPGLLDKLNNDREPVPAAAGPASPDIPGLLKQLDLLRQQGVLTEAEFQNKKAQLLARL